MNAQLKTYLKYLGTVLLLCSATNALAVDGVIEINQARALAGGVTPGDTPGFPVTINETGSYRLTGNLFPTNNAIVIEVTANDVQLDLNGFTIDGNNSATYGISGNTVARTSVRNGSIRNMLNDGISLGHEALVENINASNNTGTGILVSDRSIVKGSKANDNGSDGIQSINGAAGSLITGNVANKNQATGIKADGLVLGNVVAGNISYGLYMSDATGFKDNRAIGNNGGGLLNPQVFSGLQLGKNICGILFC